MPFPNLNLDVTRFLNEHWQRQPLVIRQGFSNFIDPIDENDLAGLAQEPEIDSRIVSFHRDAWTVNQGPFDDFNNVCVGKWTLMVQGADKWIDEISSLSQWFSFIPYWRFDDVMISYAVPGAGVGPHLDQYDVFLVQGKGKRRWKVGKPGPHQTETPHTHLQQVAHFEAVIDIELEPGDILYIPPGWPHCGESLLPSLTYSIGFRAPNARDLLQPINDALYQQQELKRYTDAPMSAERNAHEVAASELKQLTDLIIDSLQSDEWKKTLMCHLSDQSLPLQKLEPVLSPTDVTELLANGLTIYPAPGCKPLIHASFSDILFINGEPISVNKSIQKDVLALFASPAPVNWPHDKQQNLALIQVVTILLNNGMLSIED